MIQLRPFQSALESEIMMSWQLGVRNVLAVLPTGGGKTVLFSSIIAKNDGPSVAIAHRQEIVSQISLTLARNDIRHKVIGPPAVAAVCRSLHLAELNRNYIDPGSHVAVASVDTLTRLPENDPWLRRVTLTVQDEAHHLLKKNKWGKAQLMFPNARGLGVTATPVRADGHGLGRHADGLMDHMIVGPSMRELIDAGWLTDYRIFAPPSDLDLRSVPISASGDFSPKPLSTAVHKSHIVGDVVAHYLRIAPGKLGVTFAVDVEAAKEITQAFKDRGIAAEMVTAKTPDSLRASILRRFRNKELQQLVNVDLFGEGFDLPTIEVVSMARPTQSFSLFCQQFGRALRPMEGKDYAIIIDHVGNCHRHGLPDAHRIWTLDRRDRRANQSVTTIPIRTCPQCTAAYERTHKACPYCGYTPEVLERSSVEAVDGDLYELSQDALAKLRGEIDAPIKLPYNAPPEVIGALKKHHRDKQEAQAQLRETIAQWAGRHSQDTDNETVASLQRRFFLTFGIDVATAQSLNRKDAEELMSKIRRGI